MQRQKLVLLCHVKTRHGSWIWPVVLGQARITAVLSEGNEKKFAEAVNAQSDLTGVTASFDQLTGRTILTDIEAGEIVIENLEIEGQELSNYAGQYNLIFNSVDENRTGNW